MNTINFIISFFKQICTLEFWQGLLALFQATGPLTAIGLAMVESFLPALPLTGIAVLNVSAYGLVPGFLLTWGGSCLGCAITFLFFRYGYQLLARHFRKNQARVEKARQWIRDFDFTALFLILCLPFTPSSFMNFAFGVSDYPVKKYLLTLFAAKIFMIGSLAFFGDSLTSFLKNPLMLLLSLGLMAALYWLSVRVKTKHSL